MPDTNNGLKFFEDAKRVALNACYLGLYTNNFTIDPGAVMGDLVIPTYHGYARQLISTFAAAYIDGDGNARSDANQFTFVPTDAVVSDTIYGWFIATAGGILLTGELLTTPVVLSSTHTALLLTPFDIEKQG